MNQNPIIQVLLAILGFGFFQIVLYIFLLFATFEILWECGNSWLDDRLHDNMRLFFLLGAAILQTLYCVRLVKEKTKKYAGYTGLVLNFVTIYFICIVPWSGLNWNNYYQEFTKEEWYDESRRSMKMARYIIKYDYLSDKTRSEVIELLGPNEYPEYYNPDSSLIYYTGDAYSPLYVDFENGKVSRSYLGCLD